MAAIQLRNEIGLKMMKIINSRSTESPVILEYKNFPPNDNQKTWLKEMQLLTMKYKQLKVKVGERVPMVSQIEEHKWYVTKDKYSIYYILLVHDTFEEKYVFKLQKKVEALIDYFYDDLDYEDKAEVLIERLNEIVEKYNNALSKNAPISVIFSSDKSNIVLSEAPEQHIEFVMNDQAEAEEPDENDVFVMKDKRNDRLFKLQLACMIAIGLSILLGVLWALSMLNKKKK